MVESIFEKELLAWARRNRYVIRDRLWKQEQIEQREVDLTMGGCAGFIENLAGYGDNPVNFDKTFGADFSREIWVPTGLITYECFFEEDDGLEASDTGLAKYLQTGKQPCSLLYLYHGPRIQGWNKEGIPTVDRKLNALAVVVFDTSRAINGMLDSECIEIRYLHEHLVKRKDPISQIMHQMRSLEINEDTTQWPIPVYVKQDMRRFSMPDNSESYKQILNSLSTAINNTKN